MKYLITHAQLGNPLPNQFFRFLKMITIVQVPQSYLLQKFNSVLNIWEVTIISPWSSSKFLDGFLFFGNPLVKI